MQHQVHRCLKIWTPLRAVQTDNTTQDNFQCYFEVPSQFKWYLVAYGSSFNVVSAICIFLKKKKTKKNRISIANYGNFSMFFFLNLLWANLRTGPIFSVKTFKNNKDNIYSQTSVVYFLSYLCLVFNTMNMDRNWLIEQHLQFWRRVNISGWDFFFRVVIQILKNRIFRPVTMSIVSLQMYTKILKKNVCKWETFVWHHRSEVDRN